MNRTSAELQTEYSLAFERYVVGRSEEDLHLAYEMGRDAVRRQLNVLELAWIHHAALSSALLRVSTPAEIEQLTQAATDFLSEALSAFEMVRRGYEEVREIAAVEKQHSDQLRLLADTFIEINAMHSGASLLESATRRAMEIIGVTCTAATISTGDRGEDAVWIAAAPGTEQAWRDFVSRDGSGLTSLLLNRASALRTPKTRHRRLAPALEGKIAAWLGVPLVGRGGRPLGSLQLFDERKAEFSETDESILVQLAEMAAVALDNLQLYEREHRTAVTLQRALLPDRLPEPANASVAVRYVPGEAGLNVGGDWYDIAELSGNRLVIAMGDVVGRGARAAAVMGRVRTAWRAYARRGDPPDVVMENLNSLIEDLEADHFSTMVHLLADPDEGLLKIVNAGHPPPLLVDTDGRVRYLQEGLSIPLGVLSAAGYRGETVRLEAGSTLVLYTDGLIERPEVPLDEALARLEQSVDASHMDIELLCDEILERMLPAEAVDDVALLAVRFGKATDVAASEPASI
jgi:serine phosphatase RsbU (regulator of sigma subunit)